MPVVATACVLALAANDRAAAATFKLEEASIADARKALDSGAVSSVELTVLYLNRVAYYDRHNTRLNAVPVRNDRALEDAQAADRLRARGGTPPSLLGIPYTVKDSYKVKGMTVAAGSPAFAHLIANEDSFAVEQLRKAGAVLLGKTNMPPLASGGMQKGVYGRAESPYNAEYLTAAWASGSSNGSATSTAANMAMFGMGEETVSSGRSPASNNALVAYTPSRGLLSIRGNWPLFPMRDVVAPQTRSVGDMLELLNVLEVPDERVDGDFWRSQTVVKLPPVSSVRPRDFRALAKAGYLRGKRIAVPTMYLGKDPTLGRPIKVRPSILALWARAAADLRAAGAEVVEVDFPLMHNYEGDRGAPGAVARGILPQGWSLQTGGGQRPAVNIEFGMLNNYLQDAFVKANADPNLPSWAAIEARDVFPTEPGGMEEKGLGLPHSFEAERKAMVAGIPKPEDLPGFADALRGVEKLRQIDLEDWMKANRLDLVVFPSAADIGKADANMVEADYLAANENGVFFSNMNHAIRHLGIPSVSVPMGLASDIGMPVNLTFIGPAYGDNDLLRAAFDYESATHNRRPAPRTPALADEVITYDPVSVLAPDRRPVKTPPRLTVAVPAAFVGSGFGGVLSISGSATGAAPVGDLRVYVNGVRLAATGRERWAARYAVPKAMLRDRDLTVIVLAKDRYGNASAVERHFDVDASGQVTRLPGAPLPDCEICRTGANRGK